MSETRKDHLSIVIVGHVDAGKSTTTGHLLFKLGGVSARDLEKLQAEADALGKGSFAFAFFMDKNKEERERGVTIACTTKEFFTDSKHYTIIDAPGHRDFVKNMITGTAQADVALLMVPANKGGFETAIAKGDHKTGQIQGQTRQHARICKNLGVEQLIVGINKMDDAEWSEDRYNEIKSNVEVMLQGIGYKTERIPFIPFSGYKGDNLIEATDKMPWYKGWSVKTPKGDVTGTTLVDALDRVVRVPKKDLDAAPMMPVSDILNIKGVGSVITGRIERGMVKKDQIMRFLPSGVTGKVFSIEMHHKQYTEAQQGDNVGVNVKFQDKNNLPRKGDVMVLDDPSKYDGNFGVITEFRALVVVQEHPGELHGSKDGKGGFSPLIHIRTNKVPCQMTTIHWKIGKKSTGGNKMENPPFLKAGESAEVTFVPKKPLYATSFDFCKGLGRTAVMDSNQLVMLGKILKAEFKPCGSK